MQSLIKKKQVCPPLQEEETSRKEMTVCLSVMNVVTNDHLLEEILIRMPAKSANRFKCVSKRWNSLISHPYFVRRFIHHHQTINEFPSIGSLHDILHGREGVKGAQPGPVLSWAQRVKIAVGVARGLEYLHEKAQPGPVLSWAQRVKIAVGVARGLEYLHEKAEPHVVHRDIKSSNVLIFDNDVAKIADFDLSNQAPDMAARLHSTRVLEPFGYHAPEYAMTGQRNAKSDVYSFGVVLLELLTGRKPVDHTLPRGQQSLVTWATPKLSEDKVRQCVDARLGNEYPPKAVAKLAAVAALCVQYEAEFRPNMSIVVKALQPLLHTRPGPAGETPSS